MLLAYNRSVMTLGLDRGLKQRLMGVLGVRHQIPLLLLILPNIVLKKVLVKNLVTVELAEVFFELSYHLCWVVLLRHISNWNEAHTCGVCEIISLSNWSPTFNGRLCFLFFFAPFNLI